MTITFTEKEKAALKEAGYTYNAIWKMQKKGRKPEFLALLKMAVEKK